MPRKQQRKAKFESFESRVDVTRYLRTTKDMLKHKDLKTKTRHSNNSVTMPRYSEVEELNQIPEVAMKVMELCGRVVKGMGKAFTCPLPGHDERKPSAALWQEPGRPIVLNDFHEKDPDRRFWPIVDVYASCTIGQCIKLNKGERVVWWLRAMELLGEVSPPVVPRYELADDASKDAKTVYNGFVYLLELRQLYEPGTAAPFNRRFAARWCGVDVDCIRRGYLSELARGPGRGLFI